MNNDRALNVTNITTALNGSGRVILMLPKADEYLLTYVFNEAIDTSDARMTNLNKWVKGQNNYSIIETKDWLDFEHKLDRIRSTKKLSDLLIEYDGYITNYTNALVNEDTGQNLFSELKQGGHGNALYADETKTIGFPRLFNSNARWAMLVPYILRDSQTLQYMNITPPDNSEEYTDHLSFINGN